MLGYFLTLLAGAVLGWLARRQYERLPVDDHGVRIMQRIIRKAVKLREKA